MSLIIEASSHIIPRWRCVQLASENSMQDFKGLKLVNKLKKLGVVKREHFDNYLLGPSQVVKMQPVFNKTDGRRKHHTLWFIR